jgi:DNA anti-recombination protein RmuC
MTLPPAEPPAPDVVALVEQLQKFRQHLDDAGRQLHMITQSIREAEHTQGMLGLKP